jgi:hypothetical protein
MRSRRVTISLGGADLELLESFAGTMLLSLPDEIPDVVWPFLVQLLGVNNQVQATNASYQRAKDEESQDEYPQLRFGHAMSCQLMSSSKSAITATDEVDL